MVICLIRHGQTDWNKKKIIQGHTDNPLNAVGITQANLTAKFLVHNTYIWDMLVSSPLLRARQTGEIIHNELKMDTEILLRPGLMERDFGEADGLEISTWWPKVKNGEVSGCETDEALQERSMGEINNLLNEYPDKNILVTAHSQSIKAILTSIAPNEVTFNTKLDNACLSVIEYRDSKWEIIAFNISKHISK